MGALVPFGSSKTPEKWKAAGLTGKLARAFFGVSMYQVKWIKSPSGKWHLLKTVDLSDVMAAGVFIIWRGGYSPAVIRVGQGDIKTRLEALRADRGIIAYSYDAP